MLELLLLAIGIVGFGVTGYMDLKTTEFPDWIPYVMIVLGLLVNGASAFLLSDIWVFMDSLVIGFLFLAFGLAIYFLKQWGDGDAWLFGSAGFLLPQLGLNFLFNFFIIAFFYLLFYSIALGFRIPRISKIFYSDLKKNSKGTIGVIAAFIFACLAFAIYLNAVMGIPWNALYYIAAFPPLLIGLMLFVRYGTLVENKIFKKRIPASKLKRDDVPLGSKWKTLSEKEFKKLKKSGGHVWIKEGVRFAPVFIITLLLTWFLGNIMLMFI